MGTPFYVMEHIQGIVFQDALLRYHTENTNRKRFDLILKQQLSPKYFF